MSATTTAIEIINPQGSVERAQAIVAAIQRREGELLEELGRVKITADNYNAPAVKARVKELADAIEDLRNRGKSLVETVCEATEAKRVLTQIDPRLWSYSTKGDAGSTYAKLSARLKELKGAMADFKAAADAAKPKHTRLVMFEATEAQMDKVAAAIEKVGIVAGGGVTITKPAHIERVKRVIEEVREEEAKAAAAIGAMGGAQ